MKKQKEKYIMGNYNYFTINFAPCIGLIFLLIFLHATIKLNAKIKKFFIILAYLQLAQLVFYSLELWTSTLDTFIIARTLLSALGYTIRVLIMYFVLLLSFRNHKNSKKLAFIFMIPMLINTVLSFSSFFTDIVYSYTEDNQFVRGPLGYISHVVMVFYVLSILIIIIMDIHLREKLETIVIFAIAALLVFSFFVETKYGVRSVSQVSMVMGIIFYYMYFQTQLHVESVENEKKKHEFFKTKSMVDGLTGLLNKSTFEEKIVEELSQVASENVALIIIDLDYFKEVNDSLGHLVGDQVLKDVADKIKSVFRTEDHICRFGGDEFCIFLKNTPLDVLRLRLEEILLSIRTAYSNEQKTVHISASVGAIFSETTHQLEWRQLFELADDATYCAKNNGRDQYEIVKV